MTTIGYLEGQMVERLNVALPTTPMLAIPPAPTKSPSSPHMYHTDIWSPTPTPTPFPY